MKKPGSKYERLFQVFDLLSETRWTLAAQLAQSLDISERTLFRYMTDLMNAFPDFPVIESGQEGYRLVKSDLVRILKDQDDYLVLSAVHSTPLGHLLDDSRFSQSLLSRIYDRLEVRRAIDPDILHPLFDSLVRGYILDILYAGREGEVALTVSALRMAYQSNIPYLVVLDRQDDTVKTLGINKILQARLTGEKAGAEELDSAMTVVNRAWGIMVGRKPVRVTFTVDRDILQYFIQSPMHTSQVVEQGPGAPRISLDIHHTTEFIRYILRFGTHIHILSPDFVIEEMFRFFQKMQEFYQAPDRL